MCKSFYRFFYGVYNTLMVVLFPLVLVIVFLRWRKRVLRKGLDRWQERWGKLSHAQTALFAMGHRWWWVHAVSLGEVKAIERFLRQAPTHAGVRVLLSVVTPEALAYARDAQLADQIIAAPIDLPWVVRRVFHSVRPEWFLSVESEFWPNLLREAARSGARVGLINGRISQRSFRRYRWIKFILGALWENLNLVAVREAQDAERFQALGLPAARVRVVGHMKYDVPVEYPLFSAPTVVPLVVLGSTREGEETLLLPALKGLRIICAPRHVERIGEIETACAAAGLVTRRRSMGSAWRPGPGEVLLWDTFGDLLEAYRLADIAVIGGSFVKKGGQNPIEPAALGRPVVFGPSMENFKEISEALLNGGGALQVSLETLAGMIQELAANRKHLESVGHNARAVVEQAGGATERTLQILERPL